MSERSVAEAPVKVAIPAQPAVLQRACACGQHTNGGGECEQCKKKGQLQRKLAVGASNDPLEQEADRIANQILIGPLPPSTRRTQPSIRRLDIQPGGQVGTAPTSVVSRPCPTWCSSRPEARGGHESALRARLLTGTGAHGTNGRAVGPGRPCTRLHSGTGHRVRQGPVRPEHCRRRAFGSPRVDARGAARLRTARISAGCRYCFTRSCSRAKTTALHTV